MSTYTSGTGDESLRLGLAAEAAQQRRIEGVAVVHVNIVVGAFRAHAMEGQRDELALVAGLNQPLAVRVLRVVYAGWAMGEFPARFREHFTRTVARQIGILRLQPGWRQERRPVSASHWGHNHRNDPQQRESQRCAKSRDKPVLRGNFT